jgi:dipeptidyl aminopeptidase/acylaminoacyl peptidase
MQHLLNYALAITCLGLLPTFAADPPIKNSRAEALARLYPDLPEGIERRTVTIWSDGTRMAADIYLPKGLAADEKVPVIVFANGTGGTKKRLGARLAPRFVPAGYAFAAFDYRGWGESDSKLTMLEPMPEPDADETVTVKARAIRWQMDYPDQTADIRNVIAYVSGEPNIDPERIGLLGTSFGGGLVTWVAAHDRRVKCLVAQVPGMGGFKHEAALDGAYDLNVKQARGETEPIPYKTNRPGGKMSRYGHVRYNRARWITQVPVDVAHRITAPTLIIDAGADTLMDIREHGGKVVQILKDKGTTVKYRIIPDAPHYCVYKSHTDEVVKMEIEWFDTYLKP